MYLLGIKEKQMGADFNNANLCGASPELNDVLGKLDAAKTEITDAIDSDASEASAAFGASQNELKALTDKLQSIEIPTLPKLNLQSEIAGLISTPPGSPAFIQSLAKIKTEFGDDLKSSGLGLESLVTKATEAILGGDKICALVPNLEKESGSPEPADQKPIASKQAAVPAVSEASSVANQVVAVETQYAALQNKLSAFATGSSPPTKDTPAFHIALPNLFKNISLGGGAPTSVAMAPGTVGDRTNYASKSQGDGYSYKKSTITETFSVDDVVQEAATTRDDVDGDGQDIKVEVDAKTYVILKHKPVRIKRLLFHTGTGVSKGYWNRQQRSIFGLDPNIESTDANKGFYYRNQYGRHADVLIATGDYSTIGIGQGTNWSASGNQFNFFSPVKLSDHPGNISSGGTVFTSDPDIFVVSGVLPYAGTILSGSSRSNTRRLSDAKLNSKYKGMCVSLTYSYMERYDPDFVPSKAPPKQNTPVPASTPEKPIPPTAQPTVATVLPAPTKAAPTPAKRPPPPKTTPPAEIAKIKSAADRKPNTTKADLTKLLVEKYGGKYKIADDKDLGQAGILKAVRTHQSGRKIVSVERLSDGRGYRGMHSSYELAMLRAVKLLEKNPGPPKKRKRIKSYTPPHDGKPAVTVYYED
jgi:hypothetical protein